MGDTSVAVIDNTIKGSISTAVINYITADALDTPRAVSDAVGAVIWQWAYLSNPFGEQKPTSTLGYVLNLRYPGQYFDGESGLAYNINRDYEAAIGRYIQSDSIGLNGGTNTYVYAGNSPLVFIDPDGRLCTYSQSTGSLSCTDDRTGAVYLTCAGYAGTGAGRNNPDMDDQPNIGPLPRGDYNVGAPFEHPHAGPNARRLNPLPGTDMHGRNGMLMHGDNLRHDASNGCIVAPPNCRNSVPTGEVLRVVR